MQLFNKKGGSIRVRDDRAQRLLDTGEWFETRSAAQTAAKGQTKQGGSGKDEAKPQDATKK